MSELAPELECMYEASRGINYYTERLAAIMRYVGRKRGGLSTYAYTKEVRRALEILVYSAWDNASEFIPEIARAHVPGELRSRVNRECFAGLLEGLLRKFRDEASDLPMGARIQLMNMILSSIAEMARYNLPPGGDKLYNMLFSKPKSTSQPEVGGGKI